MGNLTSRFIITKKRYCSRGCQTSPPDENTDQQPSTKLHIDSHYNEIEKVLNHQLDVMDSNTDIQQLVKIVHKNDLNIVLKHHINAVYSKIPNYQQTQQIIYAF